MNVFLTGATGFVGTHLLKRLLGDGCQITASVRRREHADALRHAGASVYEESLMDEEALRRAMQDCDAVVHCAAYLRMWGSWSSFEQANVDLTRALLRSAQASNARRFVHLSAASVVMQGPAPMHHVDESASTTQLQALPYSRSKSLAEALVLSADTADFRTISLRPPLVWGPGDTVDGDLGAHIARGRFGWFSGGRYPYATCHVDNLCEAISLALQSPNGGQALFITDGEPVELRSFLERRILASGLPLPKLTVPASVAWSLASVAESAWRWLGLNTEPPLTREAVRLLGYPFTLDATRSQRELGYRPIVSIEQGLAQLNANAYADTLDQSSGQHAN